MVWYVVGWIVVACLCGSLMHSSLLRCLDFVNLKTLFCSANHDDATSELGRRLTSWYARQAIMSQMPKAGLVAVMLWFLLG